MMVKPADLSAVRSLKKNKITLRVPHRSHLSRCRYVMNTAGASRMRCSGFRLLLSFSKLKHVKVFLNNKVTEEVVRD